jgi:serine protease Do
MRRVATSLMCLAVVASMAVTSFAVPGDPPSGAYLGVMVEKVSPETAAALHLTSGGTTIQNVDQDGPACRAGMKGGDVVTAFNGKPVSGPDQFASMIHSSTPGSTVTLTVYRDGKSQDMKVKLGDWKQMAMVPAAPRAPLSPVGTMPFAAPMPPDPPDVDVHIHMPMISRSGIMVEPLTPQLGEFFGVQPNNKGVLVRSVEKNSAGASAGLKAGDVIVKVNDETIHDMADWKRALSNKGKLTVTIVRDKREQSLQLSLPPNSSELKNGDWDSFELDMQALSAEMQKLGPEIERNAREMAKLNSEQIEEIRRQAEASVRTMTPEMKKQVEEIQKNAEQMSKQAVQAGRTMTPEMKKQVEVMANQAAQMSKEMAKMTPEMAQKLRELTDSMMPNAEQMNKMAHDMAEQWKAREPEFQQQMQELQKEIEREMREWQENFKGSNPKQL